MERGIRLLPKVSIHAPRTGGDINFKVKCRSNWRFNPRPPHGGRPCGGGCVSLVISFQSTPPARGATHVAGFDIATRYVSIHAPRTGGDERWEEMRVKLEAFQSTPPARGATKP